jgi:hypothetical protein
MADPTPTRVETVTANIEAIIEKYGDNTSQMTNQCLKDISLSLAMLVDNSAT